VADEKKEIDALTGTATTGHDWDGIRELNTPLPRWWLWTFYITIVWAIGYWIVYPAWPLLTSSTEGVFGWHTRSAVVADMDQLKLLRGPMMDKLTNASLSEIAGDPLLLDFARAQAVPRSPIIARLVMAPAVVAAKAIPISTTTIGCGVASSKTSSGPFATVLAVATTTDTKAGCRRSVATVF